MLEVSLFWFFIGVSFVVLGASYKTMTVSPAPLTPLPRGEGHRGEHGHAQIGGLRVVCACCGHRAMAGRARGEHARAEQRPAREASQEAVQGREERLDVGTLLTPLRLPLPFLAKDSLRGVWVWCACRRLRSRCTSRSTDGGMTSRRGSRRRTSRSQRRRLRRPTERRGYEYRPARCLACVPINPRALSDIICTGVAQARIH